MWTNSQEELVDDRIVDLNGAMATLRVWVAEFNSNGMIQYDNTKGRGRKYWLWRSTLTLPNGVGFAHYNHTIFNCRSKARAAAEEAMPVGRFG